MHWSQLFTRFIDHTTKLVGLTINHEGLLPGPGNTHVQSMMWCTDLIGVNLLISNRILRPRNDNSYEGTITLLEIGMSQVLIKHGYKIMSFGMLDLIDKQHGDYHRNGLYFGETLHPFETVFFKNNRLSSKHIEILEHIYPL